ncbi:MAG: hypothetical protein KGQ40_15600, partial [Rhodospirillales bacterium]|nr:hypothetical protein [Rhodospirillales bacterium]
APGPAIGELARVLRPGGVLVAIFPTAEMLVEPHLKVPFVHWLPPGSPAQARALRLAHRRGAGAGAGEGWVSGALHGLREEIFYRPVGDSIALFAGHFQLVARGEAAFLRHRLAGSRLRALAPLAEAKWLAPLMRALCVRLANAVLVFRRA